MKLLLHACCGPCSMEPLRLLREAGIEPTVFYSNSNIAPEDEYSKRLETIESWLDSQDVSLVIDDYKPNEWAETAGKIGVSDREARCRLCYRQRFSKSAAYAKENGFNALGTTLSISPYQYTEIIKEELEAACESAGIKSYFEDYSAYYSEATRRSKEEGLYRQNYCGCLISAAEAEHDRELRAVARQKQKEERAKKAAEEAEAAAIRKAKRREYDANQRRKKEIIAAYKASQKEATKEIGD